MRRAVVLAVVLAACSGGGASSSTSTVAAPADSHAAAFEALVEALEADDFATAADLSSGRQASLLALAEGLSGAQVAALTDADRQMVIANFWAGFVTQLQPTLGSPLSALRTDGWTEVTVGEVDFATAELFRGSDASVRRMVLVEADGQWTVDLVASFPAALINLIPDAAQIIRATGDARLLDELQSWRSSVEFIIAHTEDDPVLNQAALAALEAIVR